MRSTRRSRSSSSARARTARRSSCASCGIRRCARTRWRARAADRAKAGSRTRPSDATTARVGGTRDARRHRAAATTGASRSLGRAIRARTPTTSQRFGYAPGAQRFILDDSRLLTLHRQMPRVQNSAVAFLRHLRERGFTQAPQLFGTALVTDRSGETWVAVTSQSFIQNPTDIEAALREILRAGTADERLVRTAAQVADALAALHRALAMPGSDPTFGTRPLTPDDVAGWRFAAHDDLGAIVGAGVAERRGRARANRRGDRRAAARDRRRLGARARTAHAEPRAAGGRRSRCSSVSAKRSRAGRRRSRTSRCWRGRSTRSTREIDPGERVRPGRRPAARRARRCSISRRACARRFSRATPQARAISRRRRADPAQRDALIRFFRLQTALRDVRDALPRTPERAGRRDRRAARRSRRGAGVTRHAHAMPFGAELRDDGVAFRLWAPSRERAAVVVDGAEHALEPRAGGWFERTVRERARGLALRVRVRRRGRARARSRVALPARRRARAQRSDRPARVRCGSIRLARPAVARDRAVRAARRHVHA